jgi:hypothetical protein
MRAFFIVLLFTVASQSWSQEQNLVEQRKYCGSGLTRSIVPEKPLGCDMSNACMKHDVCYGRCDPKGDRHGTEYCTKSEFSIPRLASKAQCDSAFFAEIRKDNPGKPICVALGGAYAGAVVVFGQGPFNGRTLSIESLVNIANTSGSAESARDKSNILTDSHVKGKIDLNSSKVLNGALQLQRVVPVVVPRDLTTEQLDQLKRQVR